jgi:N-carbamoylputrescine amidase
VVEGKTMVKLAGIQISCCEDKGRNVEKAVKSAQIAIEKGARLICFQELFTTHWFPREMNKDYFSLAETIDGLTITRMRKLAKEHEVALVCPIFEMEESSFYNSAIVIDAGGEILGSYRKVHVPQIPLWEERYYFSSGDHGFPVFETKFAPIGVQICWDNFFPEGSRILALKGAKIIFSPTAAAFASQRKWETVISSNAIVNGVYVFRVNRVGSEDKQDFYGRSFCISPEGELLDKPTGMKDSIALVEIDLKGVDKARKEWPFLKDRKPERYEGILHRLEGEVSRERGDDGEEKIY